MNQQARAVLSGASIVAAVGLLLAMPHLVGVGWADIGHRLGAVGPWTLAGLAALWIAGLAAYTFVLVASLPGLTHWRAFQLNAAGSGVSNLLPLGGALGVAATFTMARPWGHSIPAITASTVVTGVWNVLARMLLPAIGIIALVVVGEVPNRQLSAAAATAGITLILVAAAIGAALSWEGVALSVDRFLGRIGDHLPSRIGDLLRSAGAFLLRVRADSLEVLRSGWPGLTAGMIGYFGLQGVLLAGCLAAAGQTLPIAELIAVFSINRVLTSAVVTPGGSGITETGTAASLLHFGVEAGPAATAVVLYSFFTHIIEIPVGGLVWAGWLLRRPARTLPKT
ncbi:MAG: lysylphosphatidylglycerol synthase transmembrane domain-containing protein [Streptosporangiaceae bacterium]